MLGALGVFLLGWSATQSCQTTLKAALVFNAAVCRAPPFGISRLVNKQLPLTPPALSSFPALSMDEYVLGSGLVSECLELERASERDAMPAPSAEIVLMRVAISAYLETNSKKKGDAFLRSMAEILRDEESLSAIVPIRPAVNAKDVAHARRGAIALFRALLPTFVAKVQK